MLCGFLFAPLPLTIAFEPSGFFGGALAAMLRSIALVPLTLVIWAPPYIVLRHHGWLKLWHFLLAGAISGSTVGALFLLATSWPWLSGKLPPGTFPVGLERIGLAILGFSAGGIIIACTFWVLVHSRLGTRHLRLRRERTSSS